MEGQNLDVASEYINNLLLARGLLRNGKRIDFAHRDADDGDGTMVRTINLIHDLVVRRDREAEQRETLAGTIRTLRQTETKQTLEIERLESQNSDLSRSVALAEAQERAFRSTVRDADATIRGLKEQMQRMKSSIHQIRSQCATDVRKRDVEMQKLKSHLAERQRGKRDGLGVITITIQPPPKQSFSHRTIGGGENLAAPGYSLTQETTEFLTQLCQNLSDENDALIQLGETTIQTLRHLQGLPDTPCNRNKESFTSEDGNTTNVTRSPHELLSTEMGLVLEQLRTLLTNPSFVPLEEVELRDNEIARLRDGWEKMEARWKEAVSAMDGWHKRMADGEGPMNAEELKVRRSLPTEPNERQDVRDASKNTSFACLIDEERLGSASRVNTPSKRKPSRHPSTIQVTKITQHASPLRECSGNRPANMRTQEEANEADGSLESPQSLQENEEVLLVKKATTRSRQHPSQKPQGNIRVSKQTPSVRSRIASSKPMGQQQQQQPQQRRVSEENRKKVHQGKQRNSSAKEIADRGVRKRRSLNRNEI
ncbi:hypothetical protein FQN57_001908 [Myotisia sp. PD_48]|nr:hypothetical protein FQN57_001908 [Myotisia sp. PD_48]